MRAKTKAIKTIRALPHMTARATGCEGEIRVAYRASTGLSKKEIEAMAYYADCSDDAIDTARIMSNTITKK